MYQFDRLVYNSGLANEPEPQDRNIGETPFSVEDQLKVFKTSLDAKVKPTKPTITIPGFLFRDLGTRVFPLVTTDDDLITAPSRVWLSRNERDTIAFQREKANCF